MDRTKRRQRVPVLTVAVFAALSMGILALGAIYYQREKDRLQADASAQLAAIADLKCNQIVAWRRERLGDGEMVSRNPYNSSRIAGFLAHPYHGVRSGGKADRQEDLEYPLGAVLYTVDLSSPGFRND